MPKALRALAAAEPRAAAFTPGPWRGEEDDYGDVAIMGAGETLAIAAVVNGEMRRVEGEPDEHAANAALIAAAPTMFAALRQVVTEGECYCADGVADSGPCGWCEAKYALAAAER